MKKVKFLFITCMILVCFAGFAKDNSGSEKVLPKDLDIYLLIGQSNMSGVAPIRPLDTVTLQNVYLFNDKNQWEKAKNLSTGGINRYSTVVTKSPKLGPGYAFAKKIADYTGRDIGIVSNAKGGTGIGWWQKGYSGENDFNLYEDAVARAKAALAAMPGSKIKGIIWHQGESDNSSAKSAMYIKNLSSLINDLRKDFNDEAIPFIAGEVGTWNNRGKGVNPEIRKIKENIPYTDWVGSEGLTSINLEKNDPHFDTYSQRVLGGRYADKALELVYKIPVDNVVLYSENGYTGRSVALKAGEYTSTDLEIMGIGNGEIASVKVASGSKVLLFPGDFSTKPYDLSKSKSEFGSQRFSSVKVIAKK